MVKKLTWWNPTGGEWIADVPLVTHTDGNMVGNLAVGVGAAQARAWINTLQVPALLGVGAVSVDHTFRSAGNIWVSKVVRNTLARGSSLSIIAHGIGATW